MADDATHALQKKLGRALKEGRERHEWTQAEAAFKAGLSRSEWSTLELGRKSSTLRSLNRAAHAVNSSLSAYLEQVSAASLPRDAVHLRNQELVLRVAAIGGWRGVPEAALDRELARSRHADVVLERRQPPGTPDEYALCEVTDWVEDVGEAVRDFQRRLAALDLYAVSRMRGEEPPPKPSGFWLLRATKRNRQLVGEHRNFFRARFPGSGRAWFAALTQPSAPIPNEPALLWVSVSGERIFAARLG
jgi:transcriptional regulator with XRE-family HTH domain